MLLATKLLKTSNSQLLAPYIRVINKYGTLEDSEALYTQFVQTNNPALLEPIMLHGDGQIAADLFKRAISRNKLRDGFPIEVLTALSFLGHGATEHMLIDYYSKLHQDGLEWELHKIVCLGLLNYSCKGYEDIIIRETEKCLSASLFPEFIPVLAYKTGDSALAERMYIHGCAKASSNSNAGLILGIALFGQAYREKFKSIIINPEWEAASSATGNRKYTLMGMNYLGISLQELFQDLKNQLSDECPIAEVLVLDFLSLLSWNLHANEHYPVRQVSAGKVPSTMLYHDLFLGKGSEGKETVIGLIAGYAKQHKLDWAYVCEEASLLEDRYREEAIRELELFCYKPLLC